MDSPLVRSLSEAFFQTLSSDQVSGLIPSDFSSQFHGHILQLMLCHYMQRVRKNAEENIKAASGQSGFALSVLQVCSLSSVLKQMPET